MFSVFLLHSPFTIFTRRSQAFSFKTSPEQELSTKRFKKKRHNENPENSQRRICQSFEAAP